MSSKVIFNPDGLFISVGIDVGADFSWMSVALLNQQFAGKPYKILHNSMDSLSAAVSKIKEAEELYSLESRIFLESMGIYHYPLFCYLRDKGFNCSVINPIITRNSTNTNIRKVHNDRFDSKKAALVGLTPDLKVSLMPSGLALDCRNLCHEYYDLMDNRSSYVNKLQGELRIAFPQYLGIFSKVTVNTSLTLLETYASPTAFLEADKQEIIDIIRSTARFGLTYARNKYNAIIRVANEADEFGYIIDSNIKRIQLYISFIRKYDEETSSILEAMHELVNANEDTDFLKRIHLIETFKGAGFLSAVTRRVIHTLALQSISTSHTGEAKNPVLRNYYLKKCESKPKLVAMGAVSHKVCNVIFAILRYNKPFEIINPDDHIKQYNAAKRNKAA